MYTQMVVAFLFAMCIAQGSAMKWKDCSDGSVKSVTVPGCADVDVCPIKKGTNATITFDFTAGFPADSAKSIVHGIIAGVPIPFPLPQPDACHTAGSGVTCPLKAQTAYAYQSIIPVLSSYPSISVAVKWELKDSNGKDIFCALIPITITG